MEVKMATDKQKFAYNLIYTTLACKDVPFESAFQWDNLMSDIDWELTQHIFPTLTSKQAYEYIKEHEDIYKSEYEKYKEKINESRKMIAKTNEEFYISQRKSRQERYTPDYEEIQDLYLVENDFY